jgi:hypothetical protein
MPENTNTNQQILAPEPEATEFPLLEDPSGVIALFDERLTDGGGLPILDLPRIRVPSGGALSFRIDTPGGEEQVKKLEGVISAYRSSRVYWKSRAAGKKPPDCSSTDGFTGIGDPGGECADCPYARFGSGINPDGSPSAGQACKSVRQILFLLKGELLPHLLNVPPTSVKAFEQYTLTLLSARARYWAVFTEISLEKAESQDRISYAKIVFRLGRRQEEKNLRVFEAFHGRMKSVLKESVINAVPYEVIGQEQPVRRLPPGVSLVEPAPEAGPTFRPEGDDDIPF